MMENAGLPLATLVAITLQSEQGKEVEILSNQASWENGSFLFTKVNHFLRFDKR